jgi:hypothetical protein
MTTRLAKLAAALMASAMTIGLAHAAELTCSGTDTKAALQQIIDDNVTKGLREQNQVERDFQNQNPGNNVAFNANLVAHIHQICDNDPQRQLADKTYCDTNLAAAEARLAAATKTSTASEFTITPEAIITTDQTDRMVYCKATLISHGPTGTVSFSFTTGRVTAGIIQLPIEYTVERTDAGQLYVTVYGLR